MRLTKHAPRSRDQQARRGAITLLTAITIPVLLLLTAFAVNVAYMQMVREQLRVACDSSAKAALVNYGATQSTTTAISFAQTVANMNPVAGKPISLSASNVLFGNAAVGGNGIYSFAKGGTPTNSVQVNGSASAPLFMATFLPLSTFKPNQTSTVTRISHDVLLVLDRSASMAFDMSANEFSYPDIAPYSTNPLITNYFSAPAMPPSSVTMPVSNTSALSNYSRWASLTNAVYAFLGVLQARNLDVHVGLVTYAETFSFGTYSATEASLDVQLTSNYYLAITTAMNNWGTVPLLGDTNIQAGLNMAATELTGPRARTTADRTIILLTDGVATSGNTDIATVATGLREADDLVIDTITFSAEAGGATAQAAMQGAATNGNGQYYYAPTAAQLQTAFTTIADSLPAVLVQQ